MREEYPPIILASHEAVVKMYWPGRKLKLDKACLRGGYRSLRPLQKSQALCLHGRRRPRRETRREPGMTTGNALSNLYRVRERREGPESRPCLGLARYSVETDRSSGILSKTPPLSVLHVPYWKNRWEIILTRAPSSSVTGCCFAMYLFASRVGSKLENHAALCSEGSFPIPRTQQRQQRVIVCTKNGSLFKLHVCQPFIVPAPLSCTCEPVASESTFCSPTRGISTSFGSSIVKTLGDDMSYSASCSNGCFGAAVPCRLPALSRRLHPC